MNRRGNLRLQIKTAWNAAIQQDYQQQRINSERSLQASLWAQLNSILPSDTRRMFIEPCLSVTNKNKKMAIPYDRRFPDIVVCNTKEIIGIIEIKYAPRVKPNWDKDLQTFSWICANREILGVKNERHRGVSNDERFYKLSSDLLLVWAGVHSDQSATIKQYLDPNISDSFLELHARTKHGEHPTLDIG